MENIARALDWLEGLESPICETEQIERVYRLQSALIGQSGPEICRAYRRIAALGTRLDGWMNSWQEVTFNGPLGEAASIPFSGLAPLVLAASIRENPAPDLLELAEEFQVQEGGMWAVPVLYGVLRTRDSREAWEQGGRLLLDLETADREAVLQSLFLFLRWDEEQKRFLYRIPNGKNFLKYPLAAPLDMGWYDLLMSGSIPFRWEAESILRDLIQPDNPALCRKLGRWFYFGATHRYAVDLHEGRTQIGHWLNWYIEPLLQCGWQDWRDFLPLTAKNEDAIRFAIVKDILLDLPLPGREKAEILLRLSGMVQRGEFTDVWWRPDQIRPLIRRFKKEDAS